MHDGIGYTTSSNGGHLPAQHPVKRRCPWRVPCAQWQAAPRVLPARLVDPTTAGGRGHGDLHKKVCPATDLSFATSTRLKSPPSKLIPRLDLCTSLTTYTNVGVKLLLGARSDESLT
jgi:hypothetical protein